MKINRKKVLKKITFGEIDPATAFTLEGRFAIFMKIDMSRFNIFCNKCDEEIYIDNDFAIDLETGEIIEFDYKTSIIPIDCELNEI